MSQVNVEGRIESLPIEAQEAIRDIVLALNDLRTRHQRGAGSPEGRIVGYKGHLWERADSTTAKTTLYVFEGTDGANTGWQQLRT